MTTQEYDKMIFILKNILSVSFLKRKKAIKTFLLFLENEKIKAEQEEQRARNILKKIKETFGGI